MKKKNARLADLIDEGIEYYRSAPTEINNVKGFVFYLAKPLTEKQKENIMKWKNTAFLTARSQYVPEQVKSLVAIYNKAIRA